MDPGALFRRSNRDKDDAANAAAQAEFNDKRRMWVPDPVEGFLPGWIKSQSGDEGSPDATAQVVIASTGEMRNVPLWSLSPMNPPQFDGVEDIADLTHLNEASVINILKLRYGAGTIYYLFLISLNPYRSLPIYTPRIIAQYRSRRREENSPHIFAVAERAWQQIGEERESQSILITGESGAGKTENTKKVIQYLAAIASSTISSSDSSSSLSRSKSISTAPLSGLPRSSSYKGKEADEIDLYGLAQTPNQQPLGLLERQILQANPILEAFGNAQTMRNNNSSRFGKFIRIFFSPSGAIAGANIDWYLLEKSRVTARAEGERCFHVFYQLLRGAKEAGLSQRLLLDSNANKYEFLKRSRLEIDGVDDLTEWRLLIEALSVVGFSEEERLELFRIPAVILHIGNIILTGSSSNQALLPSEHQPLADKVCHLLGIPVKEFSKAVLSPKVLAGREWVTQSRTKKQAEDELSALCKYMYEKTFGWMVERINKALDRPSAKSLSIGVLDIAGFEIFEENSYEQLLINFTNEKLQQFFNFHMFTLEQEEYAREGIEWNYVNFGLDLQPTIELIESSQPIGILSCLDEECIMPRATDVTFTEKVTSMWEPRKGSSPRHPGSSKFRSTRFGAGFTVRHYAGDVEYRTSGWLEKNKDPINDAVARLLAQSEIPSIANLFADYAEEAATTGVHKKVKRGAFRTVGQRHKEQLGQLMQQLSATQPHFVRCIVPNTEKKPGKVEMNLVMDQLRCNGVLEGIRIARLGYPNRHSFAEFRQRYEVLTPGIIPKGYIDGRKAAEKIAKALELDEQVYKIGATKIFFKAGVLAELEERRDNLLTDLFKRFQGAARMSIARRKFKKLLNRSQAVQTIQRNARIYIQLRDWPWWSLYVKVRPLLSATRTDDELVRKQAELTMAKERAERDEAEKRRLEDLRVAMIAEKQKIEVDLEAERQLARDKDRMLERSKQREAELLEKISELENDIDILDGDREAALREAEKAKRQVAQMQLDFDQLVEQASLLEKEGSAWRQREAELLRETKDRSQGLAKVEKDRVALEQTVDELKREVEKKEETSRRTKERADMSILELEKRLQLEKNKLESGNTQVAALKDDLLHLKTKHDDLAQLVKQQEKTLAAKQRQIGELENQRAATQKAQEKADQSRSALTVKIDALTAELQAKDKERQSDASVRQRLEKELDDLRKVMAAKSSEDVKRQEADRSREAEMGRLRDQVGQLQQALDHQRDSSAQLANKLKVDVESLRTSHTTALKDLKAAQSLLKEKEAALVTASASSAQADAVKRQVEAEVVAVRDRLQVTENKLQTVSNAKEDMEKKLSKAKTDYDDLEDAVLAIENEKSDWAKRLEMVSRLHAEELSKRQHLEQQIYDSQVELAEHRNVAMQAERDLAKAAGDIKARDAEIALLRSRENKTVVEHYHVLEQAKKFTDNQLAEQIKENSRLNTVLKSLEVHRNRLIADLEDTTRQLEKARSARSREARSARASLTAAEKDESMLLEEANRAKQIAEARVASLEKDLQDQRRQMSLSSNTLSPSRPSTSSDLKIQRQQEEIARLEEAYKSSLAENSQLLSELSSIRSQSRMSTNENAHLGNRADLLRGLQQSHDALGKDMSDQLRKLDATPLTPSRRTNTSFSMKEMKKSFYMKEYRIYKVEKG
ncbi:hypothetical protein TREMEDRAFT_68898 [Tremella mesenterica DSM 1558]|uniref:uncharacterized protein n=1 Tax=Tremella mesenterica (strain ATCC 24925 / CBS 8224 / DSM 1558 / NBRC 9311 / NRRL Y-6157 / RJB 2259-6 / UBC 559-6) TaxID=578456 RepID=UPI0003F49BDC|nr:uncharacterized protein TREMEDRAFT_68898 [Tremella mesenterica DSM 1558]EIW68985.1 hypothetical protein TREMEDRAFT_68898 [Tremella mesenterica DSM 1558]